VADQVRVRLRGPLEPYAAGFSEHLRGLGYTQWTAPVHLRLAARLSDWLEQEGLGAGELSTQVAERFQSCRRSTGRTRYVSVEVLQPLLGYLRGIGVAPAPTPVAASTPAELLLEQYGKYLTQERGVSIGTALRYVGRVRPFVHGRVRAGTDAVDIERIDASDVVRFVLADCAGRSAASAADCATSLRSFLRWLHLVGWVGADLAGAVPVAARWRLASLPRALGPGAVQAMLDCCDRTTPSGLRAYAILVLLARLGLRAGDVAALDLDDVKWRSGEIVVQGKSKRSERLPLPVDVGAAVASYLQHARPAGALDRSVFIRLYAPHTRITPSTVTHVVISAGSRCGIGHVTAHRLRHTAATEMLRAGATLGEVAQVLRHRGLKTTAIYAKTDREALRSIARPWPVPAGHP